VPKLKVSAKRTVTGHPGSVRQPWHPHGKADKMIAGRENGQIALGERRLCCQLSKTITVGRRRLQYVNIQPAMELFTRRQTTALDRGCVKTSYRNGN